MSGPTRTNFEGFAEFATRTIAPPTALSTRQLAKLNDDDLAAHHDARRRFVANLPIIASPVLLQVRNDLDKLMFANSERSPGDKVHVGLSGPPGIGKTTAILDAGRHIHNQTIALHGSEVIDGLNRAPRVPVVYSTAPSVQNYRQFILSALRFFDPAAGGTAHAIDTRLRVLMKAAGTQLVIFDDSHALRGRNTNMHLVEDSLKAFMNEAPVTIAFVGTGLMESIFFRSTGTNTDHSSAQLGHRLHHIEHPTYQRPSSANPGLFVGLLAALEAQLCRALPKHKPGTLSSATTARWIYDRTDGVTARAAKWLSAAAIDVVGNEERITRAALEAALVPGMNRTTAA